ncbi:uncharacterized protein LOC127586544 isoform X2 [Pristis pectinata]|uniref:uncharacterized protein LOC127586544 isoform X2 n=1 Tax=Pristis pectinata TaxID=685728 RepID=UPI00223C9488|nr:uncharacterized protein LOC127586544 isoform X2 [Pristis pectinata]
MLREFLAFSLFTQVSSGRWGQMCAGNPRNQLRSPDIYGTGDYGSLSVCGVCLLFCLLIEFEDLTVSCCAQRDQHTQRGRPGLQGRSRGLRPLHRPTDGTGVSLQKCPERDKPRSWAGRIRLLH